MREHSNLTILVCVLIMTLSTVNTYSQGSELSAADAVTQILNYTESVYSADDRLICGKYYVPVQPLALGHPYFLTEAWLRATLYIKGVTFDSVEIRYNIEDDMLILKRQHKKGLIEQIVLNNLLVDSLYIDEHFLINFYSIFGDNSPGYLEFIQKGSFTSYLKHRVSYKDELTPQMQHGRYLDPKATIYIFDDKKFIHISAKKELLAYFSPHEKEIKKFMRKNKISFKKAGRDKFEMLFNYCDGIL